MWSSGPFLSQLNSWECLNPITCVSCEVVVGGGMLVRRLGAAGVCACVSEHVIGLYATLKEEQGDSQECLCSEITEERRHGNH